MNAFLVAVCAILGVVLNTHAVKPPEPSCKAKVDVGFLLDSSGSLRNDYQNEKEFLKKLAGAFGVSEDGSRSSVVTFGYFAEHSIKFKDHKDIVSFNRAVDAIPLMGSTSRIDRALRMAQMEMFKEENGARSIVPKLLILLTDSSQTQDAGAEDPGSIAEEIRKSGVKMIVIGIGRGTNQLELSRIAGDADNAFSVASFDQLLGGDFIKTVTDKACKEASEPPPPWVTQSPKIIHNPADEWECEDLASICSQLTQYCADMEYGDWMERYCKATCELCGPMPEPPPPLPPTDAPTETPPWVTQSPKIIHNPECGKPQIKGTRVIGGKNAVRGSWPWQILMLWNGQSACGGSLVSPTWVVTASHCVYGDEENPEMFTIRVGEYDRDNIEGSEQIYSVAKVISHPDYDQGALNNDIALLKLSKPVVFNKYVSTVCLAQKEANVGTECYITGWGKTNHTGKMTRILQQGMLPVVSQSTCDKLNRPNINIPVTEAMICGGNGGRTSLSGCHGDSGGPYVCKRGDRWELQGAVSHGSSVCNSKETYTVFSKVAYFKEWIDLMMETE